MLNFSEDVYSENHQDEDISANLYGGVGLINTPTARVDDDGEFSFGISNDDPFKRIYSKMQFFPWLEVVLRYSELENTSYEGLDQTAKDKNSYTSC